MRGLGPIRNLLYVISYFRAFLPLFAFQSALFSILNAELTKKTRTAATNRI